MNKSFLGELFRAQLEYQKKIADCDAELVKNQCACTHCPATSADETKVEKRIYQEAETNIDALINFYMKYHGR